MTTSPYDRIDDATAADDVGPANPAADRRLMLRAAGAGLLAGLAAGLVGEGLQAAFAAQLTPKMEPIPRPETRLALLAAERTVAGLSYAGLGALLGLAMGTAGGLAGRSSGRALRAGLVGLALGAAAGGALAYVLVPVFHANKDPNGDDLILPLLVHGGIAAAVGAVAGAAFGLGLGGRGRVSGGLGGGLMGALGGAVLYEVLGAVAFPMARTGEPLSNAPATRLLLHLAVAGLAAAGAAWGVRSIGRRAGPA
jgi:hypothetical protein